MANDYKKSIEEVRVLIGALTGDIQDLDDAYLKLSENIRASNKEAKTPADVSAQMKKQEKLIESLNSKIEKQGQAIKKLNGERTKEKKLLTEQEKIQKKLERSTQNLINSRTKEHAQTIKNRKALTDYNRSLRKGAGEQATLTVRVKAFFKTLVAFDLARRLVDSFWQSMKKGFNNLKALDSIRLQFQYIVNDIKETADTMAFLTRISGAYGAEIINMSERYIKFRAASLQSNMTMIDTQNIFESVTKAAGVLGLKTHELQGIYLALEQMLSKGKVTTEELRRQLGERLPGAMGIMADAVGVSVSELDKMLKRGEVLSADVLPKFAKSLEKAYGITAVEKVNTLQAAQIRLENAFTSFVKAVDGSNRSITKLLTSMFDLGTATLKLISPTERYINELLDEKITVNGLINEIVSLNEEDTKRAILVERLMKNYPAFVKLIGTEETSNQNLITSLNTINRLYVKKLALQLLSGKAEESQKAYARAIANRANDERDLFKALAGINELYFDNQEKLTGKSVDKQFDILTKAFERERALSIKKGKTYQDANKLRLIQFKVGNEKLLEAQKIFNNDIARESTSLIDLTEAEKDLKALEEILGISMKSLNDFFGEDKGITLRVKGKDDLKDSAKELEGWINKLEATNKLLDEFKKASEDPFEINFAIKGQELVKSFISILNGTFSDEKNLGIDKYISDISDEIDRLAESMGLAAKETKVGIDELDVLATKMQMYMDIVHSLSDITAGLSDRRILAIEKEQDALDKKYDRQKELVENEVGDEASKQERLRQMANQKERDDEKIEKRIAKEKNKQAKIDKVAAIFQIGINTSIGMMRAYSDTGPIAGSAFAALILALGLAQTAAVAAQAPPEYRYGGEHDGGLAIVGDGGRHEAAVLPSGEVWKTPRKNTLVDLPSGTTIHPDFDQFQSDSEKMKAQAWQYSIDYNFSKQVRSKDTFSKDLRKDVMKSLSGLTINNNSREVGKAVKQALENNNYTSRFL